MARLLDYLSRQPKPWLQKVHLDAQPEQPLLQRIFSKLPRRRPGERYAFDAAPHAFLAGQPPHPPLSGSLWKRTLVSNICWLSRPPLAALAAPSRPLLGEMDSHRVPGAIASLLILALCVSYLLNVEPVAETRQQVVAETSTEEPEEPTVAKSTGDADDTAVAAGEPAPAIQPLTPEQEAEVASPPETSDTEPVAEQTPTVAQTMQETPKTEPDQTAMPAPAQPEPVKVAQAEPVKSEPEAASEPEPTQTPSRLADEDSGQEKPATTNQAPSEPIYFSEQRSLAILTEARYLYLTGEGPLAVERLALALSGGHIHPDHQPAFNTMQTDIENLLARFRAAQAAENKTEPVAQFLALEEEVFPGKASAYEEQLPATVAKQPEVEETSEPEPSAPQKGLQPPEPEEGEGRPH